MLTSSDFHNESKCFWSSGLRIWNENCNFIGSAGSWLLHSFILDILSWIIVTLSGKFCKEKSCFLCQNRKKSENNTDLSVVEKPFINNLLPFTIAVCYKNHIEEALYTDSSLCCLAGLLCSRTTAGRQMEELMMSLLPGNKFMMSFCDTFPFCGPDSGDLWLL